MSDDKVPSRILNYLYLGGKLHAKAKGILQSLKITHILNCTPPRSVDPEAGCPNFFEKNQSITYKRIPVFDNKGEDLLGHMETAYDFIEQGKHYGSVLVHCHKGISRSATFVIGYLMMKNEFTYNEAFDYVKACRPIIAPNESFITQLIHFESILNERRKIEQHNIDKYSLSVSLTNYASNEPVGPAIEGPIENPTTEYLEGNEANPAGNMDRSIPTVRHVVNGVDDGQSGDSLTVVVDDDRDLPGASVEIGIGIGIDLRKKVDGKMREEEVGVKSKDDKTTAIGGIFFESDDAAHAKRMRIT